MTALHGGQLRLRFRKAPSAGGQEGRATEITFGEGRIAVKVSAPTRNLRPRR
jgi:hypothetical protein